jgi:16S rRNA (cytosine967-C5)-methyltransferase
MRPPLADILHAAGSLVTAVIEGRNLDAALGRAGLTGVVRAGAMDLAYGSLRDHGRGDYLLGRLLERPLPDQAVRGLLLVALHRLERRPEEAHTVVDQAVRAAQLIAGGRFKGLVNAVLRNFLRRRESLLAEADGDDVARWRHPAWWIARLRADHPDRWQGILAAGNAHPPLCLRANRRRLRPGDGSTPAQLLLAQLDAGGITARALDDDAVLLDRPVPVERISGFATGLCSVQDWGAQRAAALLDARDGMRVLDACAAPGGKACHILERAGVELLALEADTARAARIGENLARLGLAANLKVADARIPAAWWDGRPFDRILADVPCSASGVVRRHPDIKWLRRADDIPGFAIAQREILDALWPSLAPGGRMLYATCSVFAAENADQVAAFLGRHPDARPVPLAAGDANLVPDAEHDGFFYALLQKA